MPAPARDTVDYRLSPVIEGGALTTLAVEVRFRGDADGVTDFGWAPNWAGDDRLWRWTRDLAVEGAVATRDLGKGRVRIAARAGAPLIVRYRVVSAFDHDPTAEDEVDQSKPIVRPRWFYAVGEALFGYPANREAAPATFAWEGSKSGFGFASDLEHLRGPGRTGLRQGRVGDVLESIAIGGPDVRVDGSLGAASPVRVATVGGYSFAPEAFATLARRVIETERSFWNAPASSPFLVTLAPVQASPRAFSVSGTGRSDAFAIWWDTRAPLSDAAILLAHEYFHTWNPRRLGGIRRGSQVIAWFGEGFTDYYARALAVRAGIVPASAFAEAWNKTLLAYAGSPVRNLPNPQVAARYWKEAAVQDLPYQRGALLAAVWNARLRARGSSLDEVMRALEVRRPNDGAADVAQRVGTVARQFGLDVRPELHAVVSRGATVTLPTDAFGPCAEVVWETRPVFDRGFDSAATLAAGRIVTGVDRRSNAYTAGLRDGQRIVAREAGEPGDSSAPYTLRVEENGVERVVRYLPQGRARLRVQQVRLRPGADSPVCARSLSGLPVTALPSPQA